MRKISGRLALGIGLIVLLSVGLLLSDRKNRARGAGRLPRVAMFQIGSQGVIEEIAEGAHRGLAEKGFVDGKTMQLQRFNAHGDLPTANSIAQSIVDGNYDLVLTISTQCLQVMAAANRAGRVKHIFGGVTTPAGSGVGISATDPLNHPAHLAGIGTFQPVREVLDMARRVNPQLKTAGVLYNPGEKNAEACTGVARTHAKEIGLTLLEATVDTSNDVGVTASSLIARGAEAVFVGCDNTVEAALASVMQAAAQAKVPVMGYAPKHAEAGALFGLGADYVEVGRVTGALAGDVLKGRDPKTIPINNVVPQKLELNVAVAAKLTPPWVVTPEIKQAAGKLYDPLAAPAK